MNVSNALAGVAVDNLERARAWYARILGADGVQPMPELVEWTLPQGGGVQLFEDRLRAGSGSLTLAVDDIDAQRRALESMSVSIVARSESQAFRTLTVHDPSDNRVVFAQSLQ